MYLFDTNAVSETRKKQQNAGFKHFNTTVNKNGESVLLSVITYGEIIAGIARLRLRNDVQQANILQNWYDQILKPLEHLALPFDMECAKVWSKMMAKNPHNTVDKQLAATAIVHDLTLVTRNVKDIEMTGVRYINPFD